MSEQIYTFSEEEVVAMFKDGRMKLLTTPEVVKPFQREKTPHEKALEKAKKLFGEKFEAVQTLQIGGKTVEQLKQALKQSNIVVLIWAKDMLNSSEFTTLTNPQNIEIIKLKIKDLGFKENTTIQQIYQKAQELGLELCPAEVGPHLRLKDIDQPLGNWYAIATEQITDRDGDPPVFRLERDEDGLWLYGRWAYSGDHWRPEDEFVFSLRNDA